MQWLSEGAPILQSESSLSNELFRSNTNTVHSTRESQDPGFIADEEDGPDGHLNAPWVVAVAVSLGASSPLLSCGCYVLLTSCLSSRHRMLRRGHYPCHQVAAAPS